MTNMNYKHIILFALFLLRGLTYSGDDPDGPWEIFAEIEINGVMRGRMSDITLNMPGYGGMVVNNKILIIRWQDSWNSEYILSHIRGTDIHYPGGKDWDVLVRWTPFAWTSTGFGQTYAWLPVNGGDCPIPPGVTQTDGITFQYEIRIPRPYKDLYFLEDGELKTYGLMCRADDAPPADYGDEYRTASIPVYLYHPYKPGPLPEGDIKKSSGFSTVPTFKWWNQVLSNEEIKMEAVNLWDLDATEKISTGPKDPGALDQIDWNDGFKIDIVTQDKIFWETLEYGLRENGSPVYLMYPGISPGTQGYENWNIDLVIEDTRDGKSAQDPRTIVDNVSYHVYFDHLARDVQNEGDLNTYNCHPGNCWGAAKHAHDGSITPSSPHQMPPWAPLVTPGTAEILPVELSPGSSIPSRMGSQIYRAPKDISLDPIDPLDDTDLSGLCRGSVIIFWNYTLNQGKKCWSPLHIATVVSNGAEILWENNGRINPHKWGTSSISAFLPQTVYGQPTQRYCTLITVK